MVYFCLPCMKSFGINFQKKLHMKNFTRRKFHTHVCKIFLGQVKCLPEQTIFLLAIWPSALQLLSVNQVDDMFFFIRLVPYFHFRGCAYGSVSSGREQALSYVLLKKVWKLAVTKREKQPLFFQLFMRDLFSFITRKKIQVTLTPLHNTTLH